VPGGELLDLESTFSQIALELFEPGTVEGTLRQIVDLAERAIERCDAAAIVLINDDGNTTTAASSSPLAATLDRMQIDADEGPSLDASTLVQTLYAENLADDHAGPRSASPLGPPASGACSPAPCTRRGRAPSTSTPDPRTLSTPATEPKHSSSPHWPASPSTPPTRHPQTATGHDTSAKLSGPAR